MSESTDKKYGFKNLHESVQIMILNACALTNQVTPKSPCTSCEEFFKKESTIKAILLLNTTLKENYNCLVDIQTVAVMAMHGGFFTCDCTDIPNSFYFFYFSEKQSLTSYLVKSIVILQLKVLQV